ncbi:hypothetical protein C7974DRAFT_476625 [Boeremia exigua]|uniref:uncharacterized protein n=1 Tax=Boeremia exigua TaxID=749465 RepID=UPI001E8ED894|nr:uncharacterized protein C7974DRAFT_476625 [Boeremia exigua]KAH6611865.1 hypothetical protein C7974DRAFT_476625 [Boeremia exigua]
MTHDAFRTTSITDLNTVEAVKRAEAKALALQVRNDELMREIEKLRQEIVQLKRDANEKTEHDAQVTIDLHKTESHSSVDWRNTTLAKQLREMSLKSQPTTGDTRPTHQQTSYKSNTEIPTQGQNKQKPFSSLFPPTGHLSQQAGAPIKLPIGFPRHSPFYAFPNLTKAGSEAISRPAPSPETSLEATVPFKRKITDEWAVDGRAAAEEEVRQREQEQKARERGEHGVPDSQPSDSDLKARTEVSDVSDTGGSTNEG